MAIAKKNIRGLQNIRSHSGRVDQESEPYRVFLRIGSLEMEKARRGKERESAMLRVKDIDDRFQDIDAEKAKLLKELDLRKNIAVGVDAPGKKNMPESNPNRAPGGFKISY
ncbi:MAG: hypothetical protein WBY47_05780 [Desulfobacterales bacterium]|jgi:hypothetical protein